MSLSSIDVRIDGTYPRPLASSLRLFHLSCTAPLISLLRLKGRKRLREPSLISRWLVDVPSIHLPCSCLDGPQFPVHSFPLHLGSTRITCLIAWSRTRERSLLPL